VLQVTRLFYALFMPKPPLPWQPTVKTQHYIM